MNMKGCVCKAGPRGWARRRTLGPRRSEPFLQLRDSQLGTCQVPVRYLDSGPPQTSQMWPCSHGAHSLAQRRGRNRDFQSSVQAWREQIWHSTHISLEQTDGICLKKFGKKRTTLSRVGPSIHLSLHSLHGQAGGPDAGWCPGCSRGLSQLPGASSQASCSPECESNAYKSVSLTQHGPNCRAATSPAVQPKTTPRSTPTWPGTGDPGPRDSGLPHGTFLGVPERKRGSAPFLS